MGKYKRLYLLYLYLSIYMRLPGKKKTSKFGLDIEADGATYTPRGFEKVYYTKR